MPVLPIILAITFAKPRFALDYARSISRLLTYIKALREGPLDHYFQDVVGLENEVPPHIEGSCSQCGNCCLNKRCFFLEQVSDTQYQCGIYNSVFRKFSNCNSFPLNAHDIARYECPSYFISSPASSRSLASEGKNKIYWIEPSAYPSSLKLQDRVVSSIEA